jgi:Uma2 family endonuclease
VTKSAPSVAKPLEEAAKRRYTYDELVAEHAESNRPCELWDGELIMSPAPSFYHQEIVLRFSNQLYDWVFKHKRAKVVSGPIDMVPSPHRVMQPDVVFNSRDRLDIIAKTINGPVDLVTEVISLGDRNRDRIEKRDLTSNTALKSIGSLTPKPKL